MLNFQSVLTSIDFLNGVEIRAIDESELEYHRSLIERFPSGPVDVIATRATHALIRELRRPKAGPMPGIIEDPTFDTVISALRLVRPAAVSYSVVSVKVRAPLFGTQFGIGAGGSSWSSPGRRAWGSSTLVFSERDVDSARRLVDRMTTARPNALLSRALDRFSFACERIRAEDALVDAWIALEALYLKRDEQAELAFRAALRVGAFLGRNPDEREWLYRVTKKSYDTRSRIVHGDPAPLQLHSMSTFCREILRLTLTRCFEKGIRPNLDKIDLDAARGTIQEVLNDPAI